MARYVKVAGRILRKSGVKTKLFSIRSLTGVDKMRYVCIDYRMEDLSDTSKMMKTIRG